DQEITRGPPAGARALATLLPLRLAFGGELASGRSCQARLFDPLLLTIRDVNARVASESTLVGSDSADLDSTVMVWIPEHFDTVRAFRIDHDAMGMPVSSWIDAQGRVVVSASDSSKRAGTGFAME